MECIALIVFNAELNDRRDGSADKGRRFKHRRTVVRHKLFSASRLDIRCLCRQVSGSRHITKQAISDIVCKSRLTRLLVSLHNTPREWTLSGRQYSDGLEL
jgi:hypothetical protein